ncbi:hypothetical protein ES703_109661 [subsurface metagenome]
MNPEPTEVQKLERQYFNRIGVAFREKKNELGRVLTTKEEQELMAKIRGEVYGDE